MHDLRATGVVTEVSSIVLRGADGSQVDFSALAQGERAEVVRRKTEPPSGDFDLIPHGSSCQGDLGPAERVYAEKLVRSVGPAPRNENHHLTEEL